MKPTHQYIDGQWINLRDGKPENLPSRMDYKSPPSFIGWERADFKTDYRVNNDRYNEMPNAGEMNVKFAEHVLRQDRNDCRKLPREKKVMVHGI
jgi:hypothetical protein